MNEQRKLMRLIQNYSFIIQETVLYLDTHPKCRAALRMREKYCRLLDEARRAYEEKYGLLTTESGESCSSWRWVAEPWPWQS